MKLQPIFLLENYFENSFNNISKTLDSNKLDTQFNAILEYLNNELAPKVEALLPDVLNVDIGSENSVLYTNNDDILGWKKIQNDDLNFDTIALTHFKTNLETSCILQGNKDIDIDGLIKSNNIAEEGLLYNFRGRDVWLPFNSLAIENTIKVSGIPNLPTIYRIFNSAVSVDGHSLGELDYDNFADGILYKPNDIPSKLDFIPYELLSDKSVTGNNIEGKITVANLPNLAGEISNINVTIPLSKVGSRSFEWAPKLKPDVVAVKPQTSYAISSRSQNGQPIDIPPIVSVYFCNSGFFTSKNIIWPLDSLNRPDYHKEDFPVRRNILYRAIVREVREPGSELFNEIVKPYHLEDKDLPLLISPNNISARKKSYSSEIYYEDSYEDNFLGCLRPSDSYPMIERRHVANDHLRLSNFEPEIQAVLRAFGVTDED